MFDNTRLALILLTAFFLFIPLVDSITSQPPFTPSPPPSPPIGFVVVILLILASILLLIWKMRKSRGAVLGAMWGLVGLVIYIVLFDARIIRGHEWIVIALPSVIWSKIAYQLGSGGSFYYSPFIVLPVSVAIGALIGYGVEKVYQKLKGK